MTSTQRALPSTFPETLREALNLRTQDAQCPAEILTRLATFPFFHPSRSAATQKMTNRFHHLTHTSGPPKPSTPAHVPFRDQTSREHSARDYNHREHSSRDQRDQREGSSDRRFAGNTSSQWRPTGGQKGSSSPSHGQRTNGRPADFRSVSSSNRRLEETPLRAGQEVRSFSSAPIENKDKDKEKDKDEGFQVWTGRKVTSSVSPKELVKGSNDESISSAHDDETPVISEEKEKEKDVPDRSEAPIRDSNDLIHAPKFSSAAVKSSDNTEDRILAKVKGKINKIGFTTYDATKVFMQQILDSDETEFLDEFMKFVFQKAATESTFCPLYAKLLHELADQFRHLRVVMNNLFRDYTAIFVEVETAPDVGTEDYRAFLEAQERKKFRRGYSQFVAELVKLGEADEDAFSILVQQIVAVLEASYKTPAKTLVCEEYIDCLANLCTSAPKILSGASWSNGVKGRLVALTNIPRASSSGFTNKARFALMDLVDFANRGWKNNHILN